MEQKHGLPNWEEYTTEGKLSDNDIPLVQNQLEFWKQIDPNQYVYMNQIADALDLNKERQSTVEKVGQIIKYLLCEFKIPLVSTSKGYYKANDPDDIQDALKSWICRANASIKRMNAYYSLLNKTQKGIYPYFEVEKDDVLDNTEELF